MLLRKYKSLALRMCAKQWDSSYDDLLQLFSLPSLQQCRIFLDLCTMFKIVNGLFYFPPGNFVEQTPRVTRSVLPIISLSICAHNRFL